MAKFAVINGNSVINFIVADSKEIAEQATKLVCVECPPFSPVELGAYYDTETETFS
jgi:hypothetical protein